MAANPRIRWVYRAGLFSLIFTVAGLLAAQEPKRAADDNSPAKTPAEKAAAAATTKTLRALTVQYRLPRAKAEQRARALKDMTAVGPEGVTAAKELLDKDLQGCLSTIQAAGKGTKFDDRITELRKALKTLRDDAKLSKEQLQQTGLPTLDELTETCRQRSRLLAAREAKIGGAVTRLHQSIAVLKVLEQQPAAETPLPVADLLQKAEKQLADLYTPEEEEARKVAEANAAIASKFDRGVLSGMEAVNALRLICGLRPLLYDGKLCEAAYGHSNDMESKNFFAHESPVPDKKTPWDRAKLAGTTASGENIYMGSSVSLDAIKAWFLSPGHHKNLLAEGNHRQGLGRSGKYWTQMFGS